MTESAAPLRVLIADDEQLAREELRYLLDQVDGVEVVGEADNGIAAFEALDRDRGRIDVVFLDVQMPGLTGFQVARRLLEREIRTEIVFVTAFDQHALQAFEVNAIDYLLKPVEPGRLSAAVDRARKRVDSARGAVGGDPLASLGPLAHLERLAQLVTGRQQRREQVALKVGERFLLVQADDIVFASLNEETIVVAAGGVTGTSSYRTLDELHARLDPDVFWRVHRSHLVNINKIKEIVPWFSRNYILRMKDEKATEIPVSRTQTKRLREYLKL